MLEKFFYIFSSLLIGNLTNSSLESLVTWFENILK